MQRDGDYVRDLLVPKLFKEPKVTSLAEDGDWLLRRTADGAELMRLSPAECIEVTDTLDNWRAFWGRVKAMV